MNHAPFDLDTVPPLVEHELGDRIRSERQPLFRATAAVDARAPGS
jgi:hypothetical protein